MKVSFSFLRMNTSTTWMVVFVVVGILINNLCYCQPVVAPVKAPVTAPVKAPVTAPVKVPVTAPVNAPVKVPVKAPVRRPIRRRPTGERSRRPNEQPSTPPQIIPTPTPPCFSGNNVVNVKGIGYIPMNQLKIGDYVQTMTSHLNGIDDDDNSYTQVYSFGHYSHDIESNFLQIHYDDKDLIPLEISEKHLLFVFNKDSNQMEVKSASDIVIGDELIGLNNKIITATSISHVTRRGVYAPWTMSGDIIVSNIMTSNHVALIDNQKWLYWNQHRLAQSLILPYRIICQYINVNETYNKDGYNWLASYLVTFSDSINQMGWLMTFIISIICTPIILLSSITDCFNMMINMMTISVSSFISMYCIYGIIMMIGSIVFITKKYKKTN